MIHIQISRSDLNVCSSLKYSQIHNPFILAAPASKSFIASSILSLCLKRLVLLDMSGNNGHVTWLPLCMAIITLFALPPCVISRPIPQAASNQDRRKGLATGGWSKETILTLVGTVVALCAILVACWLANRPRWFCALVRSRRKRAPPFNAPVKDD